MLRISTYVAETGTGIKVLCMHSLLELQKNEVEIHAFQSLFFLLLCPEELMKNNMLSGF